jgi:hypothetical protein
MVAYHGAAAYLVRAWICLAVIVICFSAVIVIQAFWQPGTARRHRLICRPICARQGIIYPSDEELRGWVI